MSWACCARGIRAWILKPKMTAIPAYEKWLPESERNLGKSAAVG
jgi:hypothetical protein